MKGEAAEEAICLPVVLPTDARFDAHLLDLVHGLPNASHATNDRRSQNTS